jgi:hypothetical protein
MFIFPFTFEDTLRVFFFPNKIEQLMTLNNKSQVIRECNKSVRLQK